jgi:hypothetical protein
MGEQKMEIRQSNTEPSPLNDVKTVNKAIEAERNVRITSSELANLWASWMESSIKERIISYFLRTVEDKDVKQILEYTLGIAKKHLNIISQIYSRENHPTPIGFTDEDVDLKAPRLFSDSAILFFIEELTRSRLEGYSTAIYMCTRTDIRKYFTECVADPAEIYNRVVSAMLSKGLYIRPPYIPVPENIDFAKKQSYLSGFLGKQRPLNSIEISHLFSELQRNLQRNAMCIGFSQVARSEQVQRYMEKGKEIASIHVKTFSSLLMNNNLPVSMTWDSGVTESKISPFSDKLMMQQIRSSNVVLSASYGRALSVVRHDLMVVFLQLQAEILKFLEDGLKIIIENGWFEKPPQAKEHLH